MPAARPSPEEMSIPALLRLARTAYASAMRTGLIQAGYDDVPKNGLYVLGGLARPRGARPLGQLIQELQLSKQAAGQLVDTLVIRGYLERSVDDEDRRRLRIGLTDRGRAAARVLGVARRSVDAELLSRVEPNDLERTRRTLSVLAEIARESANRSDE